MAQRLLVHQVMTRYVVATDRRIGRIPLRLAGPTASARVEVSRDRVVHVVLNSQPVDSVARTLTHRGRIDHRAAALRVRARIGR